MMTRLSIDSWNSLLKLAYRFSHNTLIRSTNRSPRVVTRRSEVSRQSPWLVNSFDKKHYHFTTVFVASRSCLGTIVVWVNFSDFPKTMRISSITHQTTTSLAFDFSTCVLNIQSAPSIAQSLSRSISVTTNARWKCHILAASAAWLIDAYLQISGRT
jgi:hypothetical protein